MARSNREALSSGRIDGADGLPETGGASGRWRRWRLWILGGGVLEVVLIGVVLWRLADASPLPPLPALQAQPRALAEHLRQADSAARGDPRSAEKVGALGMAYHADGFQEEAATCYTLARELDPRNWKWKYYQALLLEEMGETTASLSALREALRLYPHHAAGWFWLGQAELKLGDPDDAETAFRRAAREDKQDPLAGGSGSMPRNRGFPMRAYASLGLGQVWLRRGEPERAREVLERLVESHPRFGQGHRLLGMALERSGAEEAAARQMATARALPPYCPPPDPMVDALARQSRSSSFLLRHMGVAMKGEDPAWAEFLGRRAVGVDPGEPDALFQLGQFYFKQGRWGDAVPLLKRFCELSEDRDLVLKVRNNLGVALLRIGKLEEAKTCLEAALPDNPRREGVLLNLALVLMYLGKSTEAESHIREALRVDPEYAEAYATLGLLYQRTGRLDGSRESLLRAVRLNPRYPDAWVNLAAVCQLQGNDREAADHLRRALEEVPDSVAVLRAYSWLLSTSVHAGVRNGQEAVVLARKACQLTGYRDLSSLEALAASHAEAGDYPRALEAIERARELAAASRQASALERLESRMALYRSGRPFRQTIPR